MSQTRAHARTAARAGNPLITGAFPQTLGQTDPLTNVEMANCGLTGSLPAALNNAAYMQTLDLSGNQLTGQSANRAPPSLSRCLHRRPCLPPRFLVPRLVRLPSMLLRRSK